MTTKDILTGKEQEIFSDPQMTLSAIKRDIVDKMSLEEYCILTGKLALLKMK